MPQLCIAVGTTACHLETSICKLTLGHMFFFATPETNTSDLVAGIQGIEGILRAKQDSHVKQFLLTEAALQAGHAAQQQTQALSADVQRCACLDMLSTGGFRL